MHYYFNIREKISNKKIPANSCIIKKLFQFLYNERPGLFDDTANSFVCNSAAASSKL